MKNQQPKQPPCIGFPPTSTNPNESSVLSSASVSRNSPAKGAIKAVLPPVIPSTQRNAVDAFSPYSYNGYNEHGNNTSLDSSSSSNDLQFFYDGNNYYNARTPLPPPPPPALSSFLYRVTSTTGGNGGNGQRSNSIGSDRSLIVGSGGQQSQSRYSSVSGFDNQRSNKGANNESVKVPFLSSRVSVQSYESIISSSSNKDSDNSCISSSSSVSTSLSFCSSASSSSSSCSFAAAAAGAANGGQSNHHQQQTAMLLSSPKANNNLSMVKTKPNASSSHKMAASPLKSTTDNLIAKAGPLSIAEMLLHGIADSEMIHIWLQKIGMVKYEENFIDAGYDMATIARMNPQDLSAIGITDPQARSLFTAEIQKLKVPDNIPEHKPDSLIEWLKLLNLEFYHQSLCQQGYDTVDRAAQLTWEDLEDVGINKLGHQKKILLAIKKIKKTAKNEGAVAVEKSNLSSPSEDSVIYAQGKPNMMEPITIECSNIQQQPYQDVLIKMYAANSQTDSPTTVAVDRPQFEPMMMICPPSSRKHNVFVSPLIDSSKSRTLRTFQQQQMPNPMDLYQGPAPISPADRNPVVEEQQQQNSHYLRRRSLESLNKNEFIMMNSNGGISSPNQYGSHNYNHYQTNPYFNKPIPSPVPSTFQYSNCDQQSSLNNCRQTVCLNGHNQQHQHDFPEDYHVGNYQEYAGGTTTLNRPKILMMMNGGGAGGQTTVRQFSGSPLSPDFGCSPQQQSNGSKLNHSSSDLYAAFKKPKPPPPPRRVHSMREPSPALSPASLPATPTHHSTANHQGHTYCENPLLQNESLFASCVKSLTNNFSEMHRKPQVTRQQSFTLPSMNKETSSKEIFHQEPSIVSTTSSSSGESMYFASDNVGTIRQRPSPAVNFSNLQSQFVEPQQQKPIAAAAVAALQSNTNDSGQNIVDSLEHIEMMLATLKTQLDSIE